MRAVADFLSWLWGWTWFRMWVLFGGLHAALGVATIIAFSALRKG